jgi:hypothetical protein
MVMRGTQPIILLRSQLPLVLSVSLETETDRQGNYGGLRLPIGLPTPLLEALPYDLIPSS